MTTLRFVLAAVVLALLGAATVKSLRPRPDPPIAVRLTKARRATITRTVSGAGKLAPLHKVNVSSNITGTLRDLQVGIGSEVKLGQYLGQIDTSLYQAQVAQQRAQAEAAAAEVAREQANLTRLRSELDRVAALVAEHAANVDELERAQAALDVAKAQLAATASRAASARAAQLQAENSLGWATLRAPVAGTVLAVNHFVGERIRGSDFAEDVVLVLGSLSEMDVRMEVGEHDVVHVHPGQPATIEVDALPDLALRGKVIDSGRDAIVKNAGTENEVTTYPVWVSLDRPPAAALSGMSAQVTIATDTHAGAVVVPIQAVTVRARDEGAAAPPPTAAPPQAAGAPRAGAPRAGKLDKVVFVVDQGRARRRRVATGLSSDTEVEITEGLAEGEELVEGPYRALARELHDGAPVEREHADEGRRRGGAERAR